MHKNAAGLSIKNNNISAFHDYANNILKNIDFNEDCYEVNFIFTAQDSLNDVVIYLDEIKDTYGQNNPEPLIVVKDIPITNNVIVMGEKQNTVKIIYNEMTYICFKAEELLHQLQQQPTCKLDIIGRANLNYYGGYNTPQIIIDTWEIKVTNIFDF